MCTLFLTGEESPKGRRGFNTPTVAGETRRKGAQYSLSKRGEYCAPSFPLNAWLSGALHPYGKSERLQTGRGSYAREE